MSLFEARDLMINFGGVRALDGLSFAVEPGQVFTIIGPNGAGKTTIFNVISRIYDPTRGEGSRARFRISSCSSTPRSSRTSCSAVTRTGARASSRSCCACRASARWRCSTGKPSRR